MFAGAFFGFKQQLKEPPVRTNEIPRQIPLQAWYMSALFTMLIGGILPFGAVFIELSYHELVWLQRFYCPLPRAVILILLVTCAEVRRAQEIARRRAVLSPSRPLAGAMSARARALRSRLCSATFNCATRITTGGALLNSGAAGLHLLGYSFVYFFTQLEMVGFVPVLLYFTYMMLASLLFFPDRHRRAPAWASARHLRCDQGRLSTAGARHV